MNLDGTNVIESQQELLAEQSVLGAILLDQNALDEIRFLEERDFSIVKHRNIFKVMRYLDSNNKSIDPVTLVQGFKKFGSIEDMGGLSYLMDLKNSCPTSSNIGFYAKEVRGKAIERRVKNMANTISILSRDEYDDDEEYFSVIDNLVAEMRPQETGKMTSFKEIRNDYFKHLKTQAQVIPTGFTQFDEWAKGLWRGWLFVSAGRPSVGKTAKLLQRVIGVARQNLGVVLVYSQEMGKNELIDRMVSNLSGVNYNRLTNKNLNDKEWALVEVAYEAIENLPIFIQDTPKVNINDIRATARQFKRKYGKVAMIAVDYLQIMDIPQKQGETRAQAIGNVTSTAKQIAREINCCFMMLSQMTRSFEEAKAPQLSHLKESGSIEQDADVVEFLWHDPNDEVEQGKVIQQTIAKGRNIGVNKFRLLFKGWKQQFSELPKNI